jgi:outer membrane receptor protein involved in Fe transport
VTLDRTRYQEAAVFGDLTFHITGALDVSAGVRRAQNRQRFQTDSTGFFGDTSVAPRHSDESKSTYLANARYRFNDRATAYLRYATGYRPGGPNFSLNSPITGVPFGGPTFDADTLKSYEAGLKAEVLGGRLLIDASVYHIDWNNYQLLVFIDNSFGSISNAPGGVTNSGAELTLTSRPLRNLTLTGAFAIQDPQLSETNTDLGGVKGERLPYSPRFTGALSADCQFLLAGLQSTIGATVRYQSDRKEALSSQNDYIMPAYTTADLRAGLALDSLDLQLYVHNLFDERAQLSAVGAPFAGVHYLTLMQPRTVGLSGTFRF